MDGQSRVADTAAGQPRSIAEPLIDVLSRALTQSALSEEIAGFTEADAREAAAFLAETAETRRPGEPIIRLQSVGGSVGQRRMRLAIANDDMPFLVDSVAAAVAQHDLIVHRLLHPVVAVARDADGRHIEIQPASANGGGRESLMYLEIDRAPANLRQQLSEELTRVLADVRAAVEDWEQLQRRMHDDAASLEDREGAALLDWFAAGAMTLLGYQIERPGQAPEQVLGLLRQEGDPVWDEGSSAAALAYFQGGGHVPLIAKADRRSTVHRRVPFDLVVLPIREGEKVTGIAIHAGLWTSQALRAPADDVPVLRRRLSQLEEEFGFDPRGHAGKALRHSIASLPRDLLVSLRPDAIKELVVTAMSIADRPRPALVLLQSILKGHLFAFVWLPREEITTRRRLAVADLLASEAHGVVSNWSIELGDGDLALLRYTIDVDPGAEKPDSAALGARIHDMVRGWQPSVEEALIPLAGPARATRLALAYVDQFSDGYRSRTSPTEAAEDVLRLAELETGKERSVRIFRRAEDEGRRLRIKTYRRGQTLALSDVVPTFENFGFRVMEEQPTRLSQGSAIHEFLLDSDCDPERLLDRAPLIEEAIAAVLEGRAENDAFNQLLIGAALDHQDVVLLRAWFRYLRQTGLSYGLATAVEALRKAPGVARGLIALFRARHDPAKAEDKAGEVQADAAITEGLAAVAAIDEDRILRLFRSMVLACVRTNAFAPAAEEALAFKLDSKGIPGLPAPVPWREIWIYSPRVEGIHLRGGPVARGGIRWSDRRDDFRTEILGLMKAQVVKNAVIVPTGAKGGFFPKQLPPPGNRDAWLAEGTESYRIFIRSLLSVTDNIVEGQLVHPEGVKVRDGDDPYFVVAADKGTASFSDIANEIATSRKFWLGDAFASGGSHGYDHKAMGITARGAWISVQRHFAEAGVDVQSEPVRVAGCGDMSGDVFGNGMLLSKSIKLVAAFDHRHIFLDPDPDPARSWDERKRMFDLPRSSWDDYDKSLISAGGGVFPRSQKVIPLSNEVKVLLGLQQDEADPATLINAILKAPVDLLWFGGIGTYIKASSQANADVGDPSNDAIRVNAAEVRAKVIGEGANLGVTQAARIEFALHGGRINTDFIDNSAGVDCSDNEVNIKIPLNAEMAAGRLSFEDRNALLSEMTDEVAELVLDDNRLQTLALSIAERGGPSSVPSLVRAIEILEESGRLNRHVEGLDTNENLLRRPQEGHGLTRPELAVLLSTSKMAMQAAIEDSSLPQDPSLEEDLLSAFPRQLQEREADAIKAHRLRSEIIATEIANRFVNRLGILAPFALTEEEGASWAQTASAFVTAERLFDMKPLWEDIGDLDVPEPVRVALFAEAGAGLRLHIADIVRSTPAGSLPSELVSMLSPGLAKLHGALDELLRDEARAQAKAISDRLIGDGAPETIVERVVRLFKMNGAIGIAALGQRKGIDELSLTRAYTVLGEALGLDWAQSAATRFEGADQWERLLAASLARDFEQLRLDFLARQRSDDPEASLDRWIHSHRARIDQFRALVSRARSAAVTSLSMLAQISAQARILLGR